MKLKSNQSLRFLFAISCNLVIHMYYINHVKDTNLAFKEFRDVLWTV